MKMFMAIAAAALLMLTSQAVMAQGMKAAKKAAQPACLNALACGPQPMPKMRKPKSEKFMKSAS